MPNPSNRSRGGRGAGGLRGLDAVPPSPPSSTNTSEQPPDSAPDTSVPEPPRTVDRRPATQPTRLQRPTVEIPKHEKSKRTAQLNFRVTDKERDYVSRQLKIIVGESGLRDNQVSAIAVQVLIDAIPEIRHRALLEAGVVEVDDDER